MRKMLLAVEGSPGAGGHDGHNLAKGNHGGQMPWVTIVLGEFTTLEWTALASDESL
ncbi:hypothetical protein ACR80S_15735 [Halomonas sp. MA07-2]|uniref:hypothetical protein n=1 Tax=unclassified Halomonas TaxID=2609666 RepID=UPI003EEBA4CD